ncbi:hypothetical protein [Flavobacterium mekongense]|uniref:hypothetical protein n=1 Tax=Flavobacterium mekongense TaxID=3379707 RepID=UPI00399C4566
MALKSSKNSTKQKWYEEPVKKWFSIITGFITVAGIGYALATIQLNLEFRMEKYEMRQDFNETLRKQIDDCRTEKQNLVNKRVEEIESIVKQLQQNDNGKKQ